MIWCAILTFFIMGRTLSKLQWIAIFGTSAGLAISSLGNFSANDESVTKEETGKPHHSKLISLCIRKLLRRLQK